MAVVRDLRVLLRLQGFRRLLAVRLLSQGADGVFQVALAAYVVFSPEKQTSATAIASAMAVLLLPYSVVGPFAGVLLDRWRRRQVFLYGNLLRALMASVTALLILGRVPDWLLLVAALCVTGVNRFVLAGLSAALPRVVDSGRLVVANSLSPTAGTLAATAGGGLAFLVRLVIADSDAAVVLVGAALYLCAALASLRMAKELLGPDHAWARHPRLATALTGTARDLLAGVRHLAAPRRREAASGAHGDVAHAVLLRRDARHAADALPVRPDVDHRRGARPAGTGVGRVRSRLLRRGRPHALGRGAARPRPLDRGVRRYGGRAGAVARSALRLRPSAGRGVRPGSDHPGCEDRHGHPRPGACVDDDFRGRIFSVYDVLFNVAFVGAAGVAALMLPPDGRSVPLVVTIAVIYGGVAVAMARFERQ
ncbi:hypothetical protein GCM10023238_19410 [Streptomyces heliomycini]